MNGTFGRKAQLFQNAVREARRRQQHETLAVPQKGVRETGIKANEVEKMQVRIESAFRTADAA